MKNGTICWQSCWNKDGQDGESYGVQDEASSSYQKGQFATSRPYHSAIAECNLSRISHRIFIFAVKFSALFSNRLIFNNFFIIKN